MQHGAAGLISNERVQLGSVLRNLSVGLLLLLGLFHRRNLLFPLLYASQLGLGNHLAQTSLRSIETNLAYLNLRNSVLLDRERSASV